MTIKAVDQVVTDRYAIYQGDSCEIIRALPGDSIGFGIHSPPFEGLYKFSNFDRDISNNEGPQFWEHYAFLIQELLRVTKPGRLHSVHVMQLPMSKIRHGHIGMRDFRGEVIRAYEDAGWIFHSEVCIWKDPVVAQQRTKSIRLLHKQIVKDSALSGQGLADYIVTFRKPARNPQPIAGGFDQYIGDGQEPDRSKYTRAALDGRNWYSIEVWQRYASPVWMDINQTRTLQYRGGARRKGRGSYLAAAARRDRAVHRPVEQPRRHRPDAVPRHRQRGLLRGRTWAARASAFELKPSYFAQAVGTSPSSLSHQQRPPDALVQPPALPHRPSIRRIGRGSVRHVRHRHGRG
jgi:hypothetical protein